MFYEEIIRIENKIDINMGIIDIGLVTKYTWKRVVKQ